MLFFQKVYTRMSVELNKIKTFSEHRKKENDMLFAHVTYYAVGNAGDTVLSECVRRTFEKEYAPVSWSLIPVDKKVTGSLVDKINSADALIIGGGGLFLPDTNENSVSGWQWACSQSDLNNINIPIIIYSVGYNYFRGQKPNRLFVDNLNSVISKCGFVGLRNSGSIEAVKELLAPELQDKVIYQPCTTTIIKKIYPDLPQKTVTRNVAFNLAFDRSEMRYGKDKDKILSEIAVSISKIKSKGYNIYIVAHCPADLTILPYIKSNNTKVHVVNASSWGFKRLVDLYNKMDIVIGMRGHAQMIPFGVGCHIISLGSHEKMKWFLNDINAEDWYIEITEKTDGLSERIVDKFTEIHEINSAETTRRLHEAQERLYKITLENMDKIAAIVQNDDSTMHKAPPPHELVYLCIITINIKEDREPYYFSACRSSSPERRCAA